MNQKSNAVLNIDLTFRFKRQLTLSQLLAWAMPIALALVRLAAHLQGGP